jgi:DNA adenine methylase
MKYMGSKNRIAKFILPIMLEKRKPGQWWVEPFVGGANIIDKVAGNRIGADKNKYVIHALISIRDYLHELPKNNQEFTEQMYKKLRQSETYKHKGYAGFAFSYSGKWLGGWCRDGLNKRDYVREAYKNAEKQSKKLQEIKLINESYQNIEIPENSLIYCDPPYTKTTKYKDNFNHDEFWQWCREKHKEGHTIFISEYEAPNDFKCIWQKEINSSLTKNTGAKKGIEKLFVPDFT